MRALILEADEIQARLLHFLLTDAGHEAAMAGDGTEVVRTVIEQGVDLLLLDTESGGVDGYELCKRLRGRGYRGPILLLSQRHEVHDKVRGFAAGADDYVVKPYDPEELLARVESATRRFRNADHIALGKVISVGEAELAPGNLTYSRRGERIVYLTPTEARILECLMRNPAITITREILLDRAWPNDYVGDTNRIDVHIARIRRKIEPDHAHPQFLHTVRGVGYVYRPPRAPVLAVVGQPEAAGTG